MTSSEQVEQAAVQIRSLAEELDQAKSDNEILSYQSVIHIHENVIIKTLKISQNSQQLGGG